ncbi:MAG: class I SAM-dependent RNA methyltransferase [Bacteroidetes bacterium]|nr:class I SAM-dependent RNA methyltransferase [Bacteroidota bacterium]
MKFIAKTFAGLEDTLGREVAAIGGSNIVKITRGIAFEGDNEVMYRANLCLRTALRVYIPLFEFKVPDEQTLYEEVNGIEWEKLFNTKQTFVIESIINSQLYNNSQYISQKTKDAIVDRFRDIFGERPSVSKTDADFRIQVHIYQDNCSISLDTSGKPLFMRGFRKEGLEAPINECLAAGLVLLSEWDGNSPLYDVMCGSGTIPIEAAMIASNMAPNIYRKGFGFEKFSKFDKPLFESIRAELLAKIADKSHFIYACDIAGTAIDTAKMNFFETKLRGMNFLKSDFFDLGTNLNSGTIIFNPPYDERLKEDDIVAFYRNIGHHLKNIFAGFKAWMISSNKEALKILDSNPIKIPIIQWTIAK